jgi:predicted DNA-binding transcriptional regulator AlpA
MNEKLLRLKQVLKIITISRSELWRKVKSNILPTPIKLSPAVTVWRYTDILSFIERHAKHVKIIINNFTKL